MSRAVLTLVLVLVALPPLAAQQAGEKKHLLFLGGSQAFAHDTVSKAMYTFEKIGSESGLFDVRFHTDLELVTKQKLRGNKKNLDWFDAVVFYTQGDLPISEQQRADLMSFVREDGKGILAVHSGTDSFRDTWPEYVEMIGGTFLNHPWNQKVTVLVDDREFPATKHFPREFEIIDEIYQLQTYSRDNVRVFMRLDTSSVDMNKKGVERTDGDFAMAWARMWGKGRVFASVLGHRDEVWERGDIQKMWLEAIKWTLGMTEGKTESIPLPN